VDIWEKGHRSYMSWEYGKPPEVVTELVSNKIGGEADVQLRAYAMCGIIAALKITLRLCVESKPPSRLAIW
jgi:hypothetical protein